MPSGTNTIHFIRHTDIPADRQATYLSIVAELRSLKAETKRVRFTVGGNQIDFPGKGSTPTADLTTIKLLLNSVLSTPQAKFLTADIANFYLNNPMARFDYMHIPIRDIPPSIMAQYNLLPLVHNGNIMVEICKGMYGLLQAGIIANTRLVKHLATHGYHPIASNTAGLFTHAYRPITFCLTVDNFGIKYVDTANLNHLFQALRELYTITTDMSGTKYCGLTLHWDYTARTCDVYMPGYVAQGSARLPKSCCGHTPSTQPTRLAAPPLWGTDATHGSSR